MKATQLLQNKQQCERGNVYYQSCMNVCAFRVLASMTGKDLPY